MRNRHKLSRVICILLTLAQPLGSSPALADHPVARAKRFVEEATYSGVEPNTGGKSPVDCLAENIDWLEHHIDTYGSIVAKQPDIWGEARLTKYRDEYERIMFQELTNFQVKINGAISQSDNSYLSQAFALSAAVAGKNANGGAQTSTSNTQSLSNPPITALSSGSGSDSSKDSESKDTEKDTTPPTPQPPTLPQQHDVSAISSTGSTFTFQGGNTISLEPVIGLQQLSHYLDYLHDIRRINEGDDTSDSPGYSLNLVRIPVSILPGKLTRTGFGAEITVTATPVITDDLMPTTFHNLAVNDVVELMGLPLVRITEAQSYNKLPYTGALKVLRQQTEAINEAFSSNNTKERKAKVVGAIGIMMANPTLSKTIVSALEQTIDASCKVDTVGSHHALNAATEPLPGSVRFQAAAINPHAGSYMESVGESISRVNPPKDRKALNAKQKAEKAEDHNCKLYRAFKQSDAEQVAENLIVDHDQNALQSDQPLWQNFRTYIDEVVDSLRTLSNEREAINVVPTGRARRELNPLNPTSLITVCGFDNLMKISEQFSPAYTGRYIRWKGGDCRKKDSDDAELRVDLLDAQRFLQAELEAAHELLNQPEYLMLSASLAAPSSGLAQLIRADHLRADNASCPSVEQFRHYFFEQLQKPCTGVCEVSDQVPNTSARHMQPASLQDRIASADNQVEATNTVEALAWMLVVESALLNDRLNLDVRKIAKSKDVPDLNTSRDYLFFLPEVVNGPNAQLPELQEEFMQATDVFKKYVAARWPIHVFAIDPQEQDQNVADESQRKRELQFALSLGFVNGQIGANSLTQFSREMQTQIETISLNQTIIGFGHGDDTFGWRFQPRVQALPIPGTLGAIRETICGTSRDYDLRHRQLEPGQRECVAIVLMPSFVPYADFDVRSNWYALTNPKNAAITMKDAVHLSRAITTMRRSQAYCSQCACLYRDNEVGRLLKRVDQLDHELPLQTMRTLVPYGNTLGGFEMFNTGVTGLAPELIGWYGAPGIQVSDGGTNSFSCGCTRKCDANGGVASIVSVNGGMAVSTVTATPLPICEGEGTTLFLVGNNFSVNDTKVIAGGVCIPHVQLVSRSIMRVTIPSCVQTENLCENGKQNEYVAVYVATPYGVTNHLHVPTNRPTPASVKDQVAKEVTSQLAALGLETPSMIISPSDPDNKTVKINATCSNPECTDPLHFEYADGQRIGAENRVKAHFTVKDEPRLAGQTAVFAVIPSRKDHFIGDLINITSNIAVDKDGDFFATGDAGVENLVRDAIAKGLTYADFADGPVSMQLNYYAYIGGSKVAVPLTKSIDVTVTLQLPKSGANKTTESPGAAPTPTPVQPKPENTAPIPPQEEDPSHVLPAPSQGSQAPAGVLLPIQMQPLLKPANAAATGGCRCGQADRANNVITVSAEESVEPLKLAQASVMPNSSNSAAPTVSTTAPTQSPTALVSVGGGTAVPDAGSRVGDPSAVRLAEIDARLKRLSKEQGMIAAALQSRTAPPTATSDQCVVNVNIQQPKGVCARLFDSIETPILHRAFVRTRECWRNVRDELPCN